MLRRAILGSLVLLVLGAGCAWAKSIEVEQFHVDLEVRTDGVVAVEERITYRFVGSWNGVFRDIPYGYTTARGVRDKIRLDLVAVEDPQGHELEHWTERNAGNLNIKIRVPGAHNAVKTVVIRYEAWDVVRQHDLEAEDYGTQAELYWNVTGNASQIPIHEAIAVIRLPAAIPPEAIHARAFTGRYRSAGDDFELERLDDGRLRVTTTRTLRPHEGLTVAVIFPPGHVARPTGTQQLLWWFQANWYLLLPVALLVFWIVAWSRWGRDPMGNRTIIPDWHAPDDLRAAEVGVVIDDVFDRRDVTAAIVDLAVRGVITIHEEGDDEFKLVLDPEKRSRTSLESFEKRLLDELFAGDSTETTLGEHKHAFVVGLKGVRNSILDRLVSTGYYPSRPDTVIEGWQGWTVLCLIGLVALGFFFHFPWPYWVVSALCLVPMFVISRYMPRRTRKGLDALARIKGMEEYLVTAEKERMKTLPMDHFEALLPYAVALGVEERWAKAFEGLFTEPPDWYRSHRSGFDTLWLYYGMSSMNRSVGSNLMAGPRSSGSSGWGGGYSGGSGFSGGFSGGGFGGGGTGGW